MQEAHLFKEKKGIVRIKNGGGIMKQEIETGEQPTIKKKEGGIKKGQKQNCLGA